MFIKKSFNYMKLFIMTFNLAKMFSFTLYVYFYSRIKNYKNFYFRQKLLGKLLKKFNSFNFFLNFYCAIFTQIMKNF